MKQTVLTAPLLATLAALHAGCGMRDAGVHFAALTNEPEITVWKDKWIAETIGTIDSYVHLGISPRGAPYEWSKFGFHEHGSIILGLANDYRFFGNRKSLEAAQHIADTMSAEWPDDMIFPQKMLLWTLEYPFIHLSEISGDPKYTEFVRARFFPGEILLGNSGDMRSRIFTLKDARFDKGVRPDKADFSLTPAKPWDFVIFGAYLRKSPSPKSSP